MKVHYDSQIFLRQEVGGISRYFREVALRLAVMPGFRVEVGNALSICRYPAGRARLVGPSSSRWCRGDRFRLSAGELLDTWLTLADPPAILHHTYYRFRTRPRGSAVVTTAYDCISERFPGQSPDPMIVAKRDQCRRADLVIAISAWTAHLMHDYHGIPWSRMRVIPLAACLPSGRGSSVPQPRPYVLFVGHRAGHKNFQLLVSAFILDRSLADSVDIVCVGGNVIANGEIPQSLSCRHVYAADVELAAWYRHAIALIYPSRDEGFGIPPLEAWQEDCPVIHCGGGAVEEVVADAGWKVGADDPGALASAVRTLHFDPSARAALVAAGCRRRTKFSWDQCAQDHADAYRALIGSRGDGPPTT